jgi:sugar lactone lactonase YvrE
LKGRKNMTNRKPEILVDGLKFGEGPRWRDGRLWYSDFYAHHVRTVDLAGKVETIVDVPNQPSGLGWDADGNLLIVSMLDRKLMRLKGDALEVAGDLSGVVTSPCNDMVVDARGRAYVGNFGFERHKGEDPCTTSMWRIDPDGSIHEAAADLMFPNGTVITPDGTTLIVGETFASRLSVFDIAEDGNLSNRRIWAEMGGGGVPDGICLDAEGAIWVADPRGKCVLRIHEGGRVSETISFGERGAYACMLGGPARKHLFIVTNIDSGQVAADAGVGAIEVVEVDVEGAGLP